MDEAIPGEEPVKAEPAAAAPDAAPADPATAEAMAMARAAEAAIQQVRAAVGASKEAFVQAVGGCYESIAAPLYYSFGNYKLVPRDGDDLVGYTD